MQFWRYIASIEDGPVAQLVRAPPCHGGGREFESLLGRLYGIIAQLGEHLPYKQRVIGSSPIGPICNIKLNMPMWLNWQSSWFVISRLSVRVRSSACTEHLTNVNEFSEKAHRCKVMFHLGWVPEWPKGADCKSVSNAFGGSNPPPSI